MKIGKISLVILIISLVVYTIAVAGDMAWLDYNNCAFCKNLAAEEGLLDNIVKWEHRNIENGSVALCQVDKEYLPAFKKAMAGIDKTAKRMQVGEQLSLCGWCSTFVGLMAQGVKTEDLEFDDTFVSLIYSDNPELVDQIHAMTDRTNDEIMKAVEAKKHKGHDH